MSKKNALVIGAGAFGTSIAHVLSHSFEKVIIKVRSQDVYDALKGGENSIYLPGQKLRDNIVPALKWDEVDQHSSDDLNLIVSGLPSTALRPYFKENVARFNQYFEKSIPFVSLSKGIDSDTLELSDDILFEIFPKFKDQITFLSGPSFAKEIMQEQITLVTLAGKSKKVLQRVAEYLDAPYFRTLPNYDIKGVLLGGALKNVLAIAGGIIEELGYNHNTRAAMITRGIAEMNRFGHVYSANPATFYGLSGMGDLILTTTGALSRNKRFGIEIAKGRSPEEIIQSQRTVIEGYKTAKAVHFLSKEYEIRANIFNGVYEVLYNGLKPQEVITKLMQTPPRFES